jgi:hypothetical protein
MTPRRPNGVPLASVRDVLRNPAQRLLGETPLQDAIAEAALDPQRIPPDPLPADAPKLPTCRVPARFAGVTFDQFDPNRTPEAEDRMALRIALDASRKFVKRVTEHRPVMLALIGSEGTGKSHLLYATHNTLVARGVKCYARPWYLLADELRYGGDNPYTERGPIDAYEIRHLFWRSARVVFVDELRRTSATEFDEAELHKFSCWAYDQNLNVMMTSNVSPLADVMGPFAASRYVQLTLTGIDQRQTRA